MKKRLMAILLSIAMITSLVPTVALAADATDLADAAAQAVADQATAAAAFKTEMDTFSADLKADLETRIKVPAEKALDDFADNVALITDTWVDEAENAVSGTDYTYDLAGNTLRIATAKGLGWMSKQIADGALSGTAVYLDDDVDLSGKLWQGEGTFTGTFDGGNHTITGMTVNSNSDTGFFQYIRGTADSHSFVKNVTFDTVSAYTGTSDFGIVACETDCTDYINITVTGNVLLNGDEMAGIVYDAADDYGRDVVFDNCDLEDVTLYAKSDFYGLSAYIYNNATIENCDISGTFYTYDEFYGLAKYVYYGSKVTNCTVSGDIYAPYLYAFIYEVCENEYDENDGNGQNIISGCSVNVNAYGKECLYCFLGYMYDDSVVKNCAVEGNFVSDDDDGDGDIYGLVYEIYDAGTVADCSVEGSFYAADEFWGIGYELDNGGIVKNITISGKAYADYGAAAFQYVYSDDEDGTIIPAEISNVTATLTAYYLYEGSGLICYTYGNVNISKCTVSGTLYCLDEDDFGGIVSYASGNSYTETTYYTNYRHKDGVQGFKCDTGDHTRNSISYHYGACYQNVNVPYGTASIINCKVNAPIYIGEDGNDAYGGIIGYADSSLDRLNISGCEFTGGLYVAATYDCNVGGLLGECSDVQESIKITNSNVNCNIYYCAENVKADIGGLLAAESSWSADYLLMNNCHFQGDIIAQAKKDRLSVERFGALASCVDGARSIVKNCTAEGNIVLDASESGVDGYVYHGAALIGGWKYPDYGEFLNCSYTGDVTIQGNEAYPFELNHFGMIIGENCTEGTVMKDITVNGDFYSDYVGSINYFGGAIGHRCCDRDLTAANVVVNTDITMEHSGDIDEFGGFIGDVGDDIMKLTNCEFNGDITIDMIPPAEGESCHTIKSLGGFLGNGVDESYIKNSGHSGNIKVSNADIDALGGFYGDDISSSDPIYATDSYTYGDIIIEGGSLSSGTCIGQWVSSAHVDDMYTKNCFSVGNIIIDVDSIDDGCYIGASYGYAQTDGFTLDNFYYAGVVDVTCNSGNPTVGYIAGTIDGPSPSLINVYYDEELYARSQYSGQAVPFEGGQYHELFVEEFVPLSTAQMQANRYEADDSFRSLDANPAVLEPSWDYLNGADYAEEVDLKTPLVDALNAGKDGYLNWVVDDSFRGYPHFGQSWTILYYVDFGNGYELQNIEQFTQKNVTAQEIPVPDQTRYPNSAYEWQDQNGVTFTEKTRLFGDKMVYAELVSYYTVQYITNYPDDLAITPTDNDILENGYISGSTVTVRSNNTFTVPAGYQFKEWNTAADGSGDTVAAFTTQQITNENLVFYAIWEPLPQPTYSVYYVANGGNGDMWDENEYEAGDTVTVQANEFVHPEGLIFDGFLEYETETLYSADDDDTTNDSFQIQRDTYLIAQWKTPTPTYSVTYLANGGEGTMTDDTAYEAGTSAPVKANAFTKEGYTFAGFVDLDNNHFNGDGTESFTITKDTVLIAQWTPVKYSVTYHSNGAAEQDVVDGDYVYGTPVTIRDGEFTFTKEGSRFLYWSLTEDGEKAYDAYDTIEITEDIELYAIWEEVQPEETYSVTYKGNGAVEQDLVDGNHAKGATVTVKNGTVFTREGYKFLYWSLSADGDKAYDPYDRFEITEDVVLYAIWEEQQPGVTYSITYKGNGAAEQDYTDDGYADGATAVIKNGSLFTRTGYTFQYWSLSADGEKAYSAYDRVVMKENITLYAIWKQNTTPSGGGGGGGGGNLSSSGTVNIIKTDSVDQDTYLAGAKFKIYTSAGKLIGTYTTNEDGQITVGDLDSGRYYAIESTPPTGYTLDTSKHEFTISSGKTTVLTITNERTGVPPMLNGDDHFAYVIGRNDGLVHPEANITRAEVATIFFRLLDPEVRATNLTKVNTFADVNEGMWCNTAISTMAKLGIVNGRSADTFDPNAFITRAEFAAIAARFDSSIVSELANFTDISGHWARWEISKAAANGWVNGYSDGTFKPNQNITRAEAMALINRVLNRDPETPDDLLSYMVTWPDNMDTRKWYYLDVQEATNSHDYIRKNNGYETWTKLTDVPDWSAYEK